MNMRMIGLYLLAMLSLAVLSHACAVPCGLGGPLPPTTKCSPLNLGPGSETSTPDASAPQTPPDMNPPGPFPDFPGCPGGLQFCFGICTDTNVDHLNCGGCGIQCDMSKLERCVGGKCVPACKAGDTFCVNVGGCANLKTDDQNCGGCGITCDPTKNEVCVAGLCEGCPPGQTFCPSATFCFDLNTHPEHCGQCDTKCASGQRCSAGKCTN